MNEKYLICNSVKLLGRGGTRDESKIISNSLKLLGNIMAGVVIGMNKKIICNSLKLPGNFMTGVVIGMNKSNMQLLEASGQLHGRGGNRDE